MNVPITIKTPQRNLRMVALLDSGCTGSCLNTQWVKEQGIPTRPLAHPILVYNADGTQNIGGSLKE